MEPHEYPKRILVAVTGLSPQIVTETLYALTQEMNPPFVPTEVHLITTARGAEQARLYLLSDDPGWFHRLLRDYELPAVRFDHDCIHTLGGPEGGALPDIRTPQDNRLAADFIAEVMRRLATDPEAALHVSLAGGRKTMGYYLGYALSLYGRPQDRLSHVLISEPFESHPQFYYPTPYERVIHTLDHQRLALDCRDARVWLADIPFVRLREGLPKRLLEGRASFTDAVAAANRAQEASRLLLDTETLTVQADGVPVDVSPTEFALLLWLAERSRADDPEVEWQQAKEAEEFLRVARKVMKPMTGEFSRCETAVNERLTDPKLLGEYFEPHKTRVNNAFKDALGEIAARRYLISRSGPRGRSRYFLPLEAADIVILGRESMRST